MKIVATWMTLKQLDRVDTRQEYKGRDGQSLNRQFKYWHPFGFHSRYLHQLYDYNNRRYATISLDRTQATKFWSDRKFKWYLAVNEVNPTLADGKFCKGSKLILTLYFHRKRLREMMENTIGVEWTLWILRGRGDQHARQILFLSGLIRSKHEGSYNKEAKQFQKSQAGISKTEMCQLYTCNQWNFFCECTLGIFLCNL